MAYTFIRFSGISLTFLAGLLSASALFSSCTSTVGEKLQSAQASAQTLNFESRHHRFSVRVVPPLVQAVRAAQLEDSATLDRRGLLRLHQVYQEKFGLVLVLGIDPKEKKAGFDLNQDLLYADLRPGESLQSLMERWCFALKEKIWLQSEEGPIPAQSVSLENSFGMTPNRNFVVLFAAAGLQNKKKVALIIDDILPGQERKTLPLTIKKGWEHEIL